MISDPRDRVGTSVSRTDTSDFGTARGDLTNVTDERRTKQWRWFIGVLVAISVLGLALAVFMMLPLAMATDPCHEGSTQWVCTLTTRGQNALVFSPMMWLLAGVVTAVVGARVAARFGGSPLIGLPVGLAGYVAMVPLSNLIVGNL